MTLKNDEFITMAQAADICPYEQGYLSLLARRGQLKAKKIDGKWHTTLEWLNEYINKMKPELLIKKESIEKLPASSYTLNQKIKNVFTLKANKVVYVWIVLTAIALVAVFFAISSISEKLEDMENKNQFIPEEIMKVPNEDGNFDVYGVGRVKIGEEEIME